MTKRNYGIDLLRIVAIFYVTLGHYIQFGGLLNLNDMSMIQKGVYFFVNGIVYCAVDIFALISGYVYNGTSINYKQVASRWLQVFFYSFILTFILTVLDLVMENLLWVY